MAIQIPQDELKRLNAAIRYSYEQLSPLRKTRKFYVRAYIGRDHTINMLAQAINILGRHLMGDEPRVLCTSRIPQETYTSNKLSAAVTLDCKRVGLVDIGVSNILDAFFAEGWTMCGKFGMPGDMDEDTGEIRANVKPIDPDDVFYDMNATNWADVQFVGNKFFAPIDDVRKSDLYIKSAVKRLQATDKLFETANGEQRTSTLSRKDTSTPEVYREMVRLRNVWIPHRGVLVTMADEDEPNVLRVMKWEGPERGPYHRLGFFPISGQIAFLPFAALIGEMSESMNSIFAKAISDEESAKTVYSTPTEGEQFASQIIKARHGQLITRPGGAPLEKHDLMGTSQRAFGMVAALREFISYSAGNLDALGGLGPSTDTASGDRLITESASMMVSQMQRQVTRFIQGIVEDMAWYRWKSREKLKVQQQIGRQMRWVEFGPEQKRDRDFFDHIIEVVPYSQGHRTPAQRVAQFLECVQLAAQLPIPNKTINGEYVMDTVARLRDLPEATGIYKTVYPHEGPGDEFEKRESAPNFNKPNGKYERVNRPGRTRRGADYAMAQAAFGAGVQDSEAEAAVRT